MLRFALRRVGALALTLWASSLLIFASLSLVPGDPAVYLAHGRASPEQLAALRVEFHLDDPFWSRYGHWLGGVVTGDFGTSLQYKEPVSSLIGSRLATTGTLIVYAALLTVALGMATGLLAALVRGTADTALMAATTALTATPVFVSGVVLLAVFSVQLGWFPSLGAGTGLADRLWHLTLPAVGLAAAITGVVARVSRTAFVETLGREHVEVARSRGLPERLVVTRHVVRNSLGPVATVVGLLVASLLVGTTVVETAFGIDGVGSLLNRSVQTKDFPVVQAISLLVVAAFLVCNTVVDLLYPLIDPRLAPWKAAR